MGIAVNAAVALAARHFPFQDAANHIARYTLLAQAWWGAAPAEVHVRLLPTPYIALDVLGAALVRVAGPDVALRVLVLLAVVLLPVGMDLLLRQTAPHRRGWALAGVLLGFSWYLLDGLLNFVVGAGLVFVWLAWWWPRRDGAGVAPRLALGAGAAGLFLVHLSAPLSALVVVWVDLGLAVLARVRAPRAWTGNAPVRPRVTTALAITAAVAAVFVAWTLVEVALGAKGSEGAVGFRGPALKLAALGAPFYAFDLRQALLLAGGWAASLVAFLYVNRADLRPDPILASAAAFGLLFVAWPHSVGAAGGLDARWLIFAYLLPFCATEGGRVPRQWPGLAVALLAVAAHAGAVGLEVRRRDPLLTDYDAVLAQLPRGSRLLPVVADGGAARRVGVYEEYAFWHVVRNAGRVPGLFNRSATRPTDPPFPHFAHFDLSVRRYVPPFGWGVKSFEPLDWRQIARDYDYIVQAGGDPRVARYLGAHARVRRRVGAVTLYEVGRGP